MNQITVTMDQRVGIIFRSEFGNCILSHDVEFRDVPCSPENPEGYEEVPYVLISGLDVSPKHRRQGHGAGEFGSTLWTLSKIYLIFRILTLKNSRGVLLNGAVSWKEWAYGGYGLVYDCAIAERLCTPSELHKKRGGELEPNLHESWLDVEARAVGQAASAIKVIVSVGQREAGKKLLLTVSPF